MGLKISGILAALLMAFPVFGLENSWFGGLGPSDIPEQALPAAVPPHRSIETNPSKKAVVKDWTIMVYINGKNDLDRFAFLNMNQMEKVGSSSRINVLVERGRTQHASKEKEDWTGTRRYYITRDLFGPDRIKSPVVEELGKVNMGDWKELAKFGLWAKEKYPARRYMLIVWNHGSGWQRDNPVQDKEKGISYDDETGNNIDTPQLAKALARMGKVDIYASDACLMQMAEVGYEIEDYADYIIGSEEIMPGTGYAYHKMLLPLNMMPSMDTYSLARVVTDSYINSNLVGSATQSIVSARRMRELAPFVDAFVSAVMATKDKDMVRAVRDKTQDYSIPDCKDLYHFAELMAMTSSSPEVKRSAQALMHFIDKQLVLHTDKALWPRSNSHGIAINIPDAWVEDEYMDLKWAKDTKWYTFIKWLTSWAKE